MDERTELVLNQEQELSERAIEFYVKGCEGVAVNLYTTVENIREAGKKPVIVIPSRGAIPIFLLALEALRGLGHFLADSQEVAYYPRKIFQFLSHDRIASIHNPENSQVDVIIYPFTADVTGEKGEEWLARKLRESSARATDDLVFKGDQYPEDLSWYYFLMGKLQKELHSDKGLSPAELVDAIKHYPGVTNGQIVLIDTVISGRAAQDIVSAFAGLGHRISPVLAVDTRTGGHFQAHRRAEIDRAMLWDYLGGESPYVQFPLITEDKGVALLGVSAVNFANFNKPGFFRSIDSRFRDDYLPQSCLWTLPPDIFLETYIQSFYQFINLCVKKANGESLGDISEFQNETHKLTSSHGNIEEREIRLLTRAEAGSTAKETSSHIVSINIPDKQAKEWVREFSNTLFQK